MKQLGKPQLLIKRRISGFRNMHIKSLYSLLVGSMLFKHTLIGETEI
jgi:hypothetical protein